jgi:hypothetical protein
LCDDNDFRFCRTRPGTVASLIVGRTLAHLRVVLPLLACITLLFLWVRSHHDHDIAGWRWPWHEVMVASLKGSTVFVYSRSENREYTPPYGPWRVVGQLEADSSLQTHYGMPDGRLGFAYDGRGRSNLDGSDEAQQAVAVPHWLWIVVAALIGARGLVAWRRARQRSRSALCPGCGYDLRATPDRCPECGRIVAPAQTGPGAPRVM